MEAENLATLRGGHDTQEELPDVSLYPPIVQAIEEKATVNDLLLLIAIYVSIFQCI